MNKVLIGKMEKNIKELQCRLSQYDTESILGHIGTQLSISYDYNSVFEKTGLSSPLRQYIYLAGLLMSTNQKESLRMNKKRMDHLKKLLEDVSNAYALMYFDEIGEADDEHIKKYHHAVEIAMPTFLNYFNTADLSYDDQQLERLQSWFSPFDNYLSKHYGFTSLQLSEIYIMIRKYLRNHLNKVLETKKKAHGEHQKWIKLVENGINHSDALEQIDKKTIEEAFSEVALVFHIPIKMLEERFGKSVIEGFISQFTITRTKSDFKYYTEANPFQVKPLWKKSDEYIFCPLYRSLLSAIFSFCYKSLEQSELVDSFYRNRDHQAEKKTLDIFQQLFGLNAEYYTSVFDEHRNENDLLIKSGRDILLVEIKASKIKEPFRDPEKAYTRIRSAFRGECGIQKAFNQAYRLKKQLLENDTTKLYNEKGTLLIEIDKTSFDSVKILCITAEDLGAIAVNLAPLLIKPDSEPFPWACNIYSLESIVQALMQNTQLPKRFLTYLDERQQIHEKAFSTDELDICGYFLSEGTLLKIYKQDENLDRIVFSPDWATLFDKLYDQRNGFNLE